MFSCELYWGSVFSCEPLDEFIWITFHMKAVAPHVFMWRHAHQRMHATNTPNAKSIGNSGGLVYIHSFMFEF